MSNYRGSKKRLVILLTNFALVMYTLAAGEGKNNLLGYILLGIIGISMYDYWRNVE